MITSSLVRRSLLIFIAITLFLQSIAASENNSSVTSPSSSESLHNLQNASSRVIGGFVAPGSQARAYVYFDIEHRGRSFDPNTAQYSDCGGSVLDATRILTAAHCFVDEPNKYLYLSGCRAWFGENTNLPSEEGAVLKRVIIHRRYQLEISEWYDIAIVELERSMFSVTPVQFDTNLVAGNVLSVLGFGNTIDFVDSPPDTLAVGFFRFSGRERTIPNDPTSTMIAARGGPSFICSGDSGGPLYKTYCSFNGCDPNIVYQAGIVSSNGADACNDPTAFMYFTDINLYQNAIIRVLFNLVDDQTWVVIS